MTEKVLNGKLYAQEIMNKLQTDCEILAKKNIYPKLEIIMIAGNEASEIYVKNKIRVAKRAGIIANLNIFSQNATFKEIIEKIEIFNNDKSVHGVIVQLPLSENLNSGKLEICSKIHFSKDVDGLCDINIGKLLLGFDENSHFFHKSCTPSGCIELLKRNNIELRQKKCLIINRSNIVGKPLFAMLLQEDAFVKIGYKECGNFIDEVKVSDIIFSATGCANLITKDMIKKGAILVDIGISRKDGKLCGDFHENCREICGFYAPVPGGIGPMTIAMLMKNVVKSARYLANL